MRQVGDRSIADDLTQETFLKAYTKLSSFRSESRFSTWLVRIALNTTKNYFNSRAYKQRRANMEINETQLPAASEGRIDAWTEERLTHLRSKISELPEKFRDTLVLVGLEGKSYDEAALILSIPVGTVRSRLNTARNILRKSIQEVSNI